ncbi:hypothetical protein SPSIL_050040 [Sporomusa silvacetica DSM 10669]|uniref:DUF4386 domain-containing protein n=1 Tax=Sporomusa silvacetica DSM 10669 TaxID=1123289 RepID=A0ABZ3IT08_9FIRM|nr:hypothetical protein SPSIL_06800 [Sporomusa silvacetica DSM 10669]
MNSSKKTARIAGFWYLLMAITAPVGLLYVPSKLIVPGDAAATANNIIVSESLFRFGIVSSFICQIAFIFLVLALYRLLKEVNQKQAMLMVAFVLVSVPIAFFNMLNHVAALILLSGAGFLAVFEPNQLHALVMVFLKLQEHGTIIAQIFWGLWLFPFGVLVFRSGLFPKILGILLLIAGFGYVVHSFTFLLFPHYGDVVAQYVTVPEAVGELSIVLWLLIKGVTNQKPSPGEDMLK